MQEVRPGPMEFRLDHVKGEEGFVHFVAEDETDVTTLFVSRRDVQFVPDGDGGKPVVNATIMDVNPILYACTTAVIHATQAQIEDLQRQFDELDAFKRQ